jgi:tRNA(adenine34) deaminase
MNLALEEARQAYQQGEIPVGAVLVEDGKVISSAHNMREAHKLVTSHAEILALTQAQTSKQSWRLPACTLYVTLEPCLMCMGAIQQSRIRRLVFGLREPKTGAVRSILNYDKIPNTGESLPTTEGILVEDIKQLMQQFFHEKRI